jgi:hypothetical protein
MAAVAPSPLHEGRALRRARQRKHVSIPEAAEATRISSRFLEALEREAPIDEFPAPVYARAFLREYASYLGLDSEKLVSAFNARHEALAAPQLVPAPAVPPPRRWPARAAGVVSVLALVTLAALQLVSSGGRKGGTPIPSGTASLPVIGTANPSEHRSVPKPKVMRFVLTATTDCWVHATADGRLAFPDHTFHAGERVSFSGTRAQLRLGNAGGVKLVVNGKRQQTGGSGQVVTLKFVLRNGKVVRG